MDYFRHLVANARRPLQMGLRKVSYHLVRPRISISKVLFCICGSTGPVLELFVRILIQLVDDV